MRGEVERGEEVETGGEIGRAGANQTGRRCQAVDSSTRREYVATLEGRQDDHPLTPVFECFCCRRGGGESPTVEGTACTVVGTDDPSFDWNLAGTPCYYNLFS